MAFADPETITVNAVDQVLARTGYPGPRSAQWEQGDGTNKLFISHEIKKRDRSLIRLTDIKFAADPYVPANNNLVSMGISLILDRPVTGYTNAEALLIVDGFLDWLVASSNAKLTKFIAHEV